MKVSTNYSATVQSSYVSYDGSLSMSIGEDQRLELKMEFKQLKDLHRQIGERIKRIETDQLSELREKLEQLEKVENE
jgi:hypothetical protein